MIGALPVTLCVGGEDKRIRSDFRVGLLILEAFSDPELTDYDKSVVCVDCLYEDTIEPSSYDEALRQACWFLDGGDVTHSRVSARVIDFKQDEAMLFSAINKVAGKETRAEAYMHWWTFLGYFWEIGECSLSTVVGIRYKLARGKQLEKWEREYLRDNSERVKLKPRYTAEEQAEIDRLNALFR